MFEILTSGTLGEPVGYRDEKVAGLGVAETEIETKFPYYRFRRA